MAFKRLLLLFLFVFCLGSFDFAEAILATQEEIADHDFGQWFRLWSTSFAADLSVTTNLPSSCAGGDNNYQFYPYSWDDANHDLYNSMMLVSMGFDYLGDKGKDAVSKYYGATKVRITFDADNMRYESDVYPDPAAERPFNIQVFPRVTRVTGGDRGIPHSDITGLTGMGLYIHDKTTTGNHPEDYLLVEGGNLEHEDASFIYNLDVDNVIQTHIDVLLILNETDLSGLGPADDYHSHFTIKMELLDANNNPLSSDTEYVSLVGYYHTPVPEHSEFHFDVIPTELASEYHLSNAAITSTWQSVADIHFYTPSYIPSAQNSLVAANFSELPYAIVVSPKANYLEGGDETSEPDFLFHQVFGHQDNPRTIPFMVQLVCSDTTISEYGGSDSKEDVSYGFTAQLYDYDIANTTVNASFDADASFSLNPDPETVHHNRAYVIPPEVHQGHKGNEQNYDYQFTVSLNIKLHPDTIRSINSLTEVYPGWYSAVIYLTEVSRL